MYKLLLKIHNITKMKYLCMTTKENHDEYKGSGKYWKRHIKQHGYDVTTILLFRTASMSEFSKIGSIVSQKLNIVERDDYANLRPETGDGGDTVSNKMWITNGELEKYILKTDVIPHGYRRGRNSKCAFNNIENQRKFSNRVDRTSEEYYVSRKVAAEKMMQIRDHSKCGRKGDDNVAKRIEVRNKIGKSNSKPLIINDIEYSSIKNAAEALNVARHVIDKMIRDGYANRITHKKKE